MDTLAQEIIDIIIYTSDNINALFVFRTSTFSSKHLRLKIYNKIQWKKIFIEIRKNLPQDYSGVQPNPDIRYEDVSRMINEADRDWDFSDFYRNRNMTYSWNRNKINTS